MRPTPSWPPICGSLMAVIGLPSGPEAVPALVWRSVGQLVVYLVTRGVVIVHTALTDTRVQNLCENFV
jgi:hypothetical protein